jgi:hypothetical protein
MTGSKPVALPLGDIPRLTDTNISIHKKMAGIAGFEPTNDGIKTRCLTTWRYPNNMVRKERLELSRREALEPKSSVSTNSTTPAYIILITVNCENNKMVATAGFEPATPSL